MSELRRDDMEHDSKLTALYRAAGGDAPPAALDDAILAAARREVGARPRPAGFAFGQSWRTSLSIAAVIVLSVSLVTVMREEAPELTEASRAVPPTAEFESKPAAKAEAGPAAGAPGFVPDPQRSRNIGLKPPSSASGLGIRPSEPVDRGQLRSKEAAADRTEAPAAAPSDLLAKRRDASPDVMEQRAASPAPVAPAPSQSATMNAPAEGMTPPSVAGAAASSALEDKKKSASEVAGSGVIDRQVGRQAEPPAERQAPFRVAPAPAPPAAPVIDRATADAPRGSAADARGAPAKTAPPTAAVMGKLESDAALPPEKWIVRIEALRAQGKLDEAKASLAEFRKRFPNYRLPEALRELSGP